MYDYEQEKIKKKIIGIIIFIGVILLLSFIPIIKSHNLANKYENFDKKKIKNISFYKFLYDKNNVKKGSLLLKIENKDKLNIFFKDYWKPLYKNTKKTSGIRYILEIETNTKRIYLHLIKDDYQKIVDISEANHFYEQGDYSFKSYKLYNFFKILEKTEKDLKNGDN